MSVLPGKTQISLGICPGWSASSLCAQWVAKDPRFLHADSKDSDQTGRIWVFAGRTLILLILSCPCSYGLTGWAAAWQNQQNDLCAQQTLRSALACAQSDQSLRCPHEETLGPYLPNECTAKNLIRLGGCQGWSESLLGTQVILLVLSCCSSNTKDSSVVQVHLINLHSKTCKSNLQCIGN